MDKVVARFGPCAFDCLPLVDGLDRGRMIRVIGAGGGLVAIEEKLGRSRGDGSS